MPNPSQSRGDSKSEATPLAVVIHRELRGRERYSATLPFNEISAAIDALTFEVFTEPSEVFPVHASKAKGTRDLYLVEVNGYAYPIIYCNKIQEVITVLPEKIFSNTNIVETVKRFGLKPAKESLRPFFSELTPEQIKKDSQKSVERSLSNNFTYAISPDRFERHFSINLANEFFVKANKGRYKAPLHVSHVFSESLASHRLLRRRYSTYILIQNGLGYAVAIDPKQGRVVSLLDPCVAELSEFKRVIVQNSIKMAPLKKALA